MLTQSDLNIHTLGTPEAASPLHLSHNKGDGIGDFVSADARVRYQVDPDPAAPHQDLAFERAGPRAKILFDPARTTAAIVTCGGLCPGLNNVIRSIYHELHNYGVPRVLGIRNGYRGLVAESGLSPLVLTEEIVDHIHKQGGTMLGTSRGSQDVNAMVDFLEAQHIDILFCAGGDGTQRGAHAIQEEITRRGLRIALVGVPKTIDNDIRYVYRTFGFATALEEAETALRCAHTEARSVPNGVGLVKIMGRNAGFITAYAALSNSDTNFVLVPEIAFTLGGSDGLLGALAQRLAHSGHAVIAVAEGAGQHLFTDETATTDASGNKRHHDIGLYLKDRINHHFRDAGNPVSLKYIDPSYIIRSVPANSQDRLLSDQLARNAVHAAMAGKTDMLIGHWNNRFVNVPIPTAIRRPKQMEIEGDLWTSILLTTGQPRWPGAGT